MGQSTNRFPHYHPSFFASRARLSYINDTANSTSPATTVTFLTTAYDTVVSCEATANAPASIVSPSTTFPTVGSSSTSSSFTSSFLTSSWTESWPVPSSASSSNGLAPSGISTSRAPATSPCPSGSLTNAQQVGNSTLGTLGQSDLPKWLDGSFGAVYTSPPWGNYTVNNTDASIYHNVPDTGDIRYYNLTIQRSQLSPDGVLRDVILINGQFPGPLIEANWGDWIQVTVHNNISDPPEGTSLHWHGLLQRNRPWEDGVPGVSQCPIAPDSSYIYYFRAEEFGTTWYHSHTSGQYTAGVAGPIVVHGPSAADYDVDVGVVMMTDFYHIPYFSVVADAVGNNLSRSIIPPISDNNLINGRNNFNCSEKSYDSSDDRLASDVRSNITWTCVDNAPRSSFYFQSGKTHRLRLLNHGSNGIQKFSIDGLDMTIIQIDFVPVVPRKTQVVTLGVGQRTDVLVEAPSNPTASYWMRANIAGDQSCGNSSHPLALAAIYHEEADTSTYPSSSSSGPEDETCANDALTDTTPTFAIAPSPPSFQQDLMMELALNATGHFEFQINQRAMRTNFNHPILLLAGQGNTSYPNDPQWNVYDFSSVGANKSIILNVTNQTPLVHPMHLHGHNFFVLSDGQGPWDGSITNPSNPVRRDTQILRVGGHLALQFEATNPGVWPFHCHIAWHLSAGQGINILYGTEDMALPDGGWQAEYCRTCDDWWKYTDQVVVDQIDSGQ